MICKRILAIILSIAFGLANAVLSSAVFAQGSEPLYRLYNPGSGEHFYTTSQNEKSTLFQLGWWYEGIGWYSPQSGLPVYRIYNPNSGEHHFTMDAYERTALTNIGWKDENIGFYSRKESSVPVYRLFNPNTTNAGSHHYTYSLSEVNTLTRKGWKAEGVSWFADASGEPLNKPEIYRSAVNSSTTANHSKNLSRQVRLDIPQRVQENGYYCGPASLQMVLAYHNIFVSQEQLAADLKTSPITGTEYEDLARTASCYIFGKVPLSDLDPGYRAVILPAWSSNPAAQNGFERRAVSDLSNGDPVFVAINNEVAYGPGYGTVHQVVLYGVDLDSSGKAVNFYYLDPSYKQQDPVYGGKKVVSSEELWQIMTQNPEPGYVW